MGTYVKAIKFTAAAGKQKYAAHSEQIAESESGKVVAIRLTASTITSGKTVTAELMVGNKTVAQLSINVESALAKELVVDFDFPANEYFSVITTSDDTSDVTVWMELVIQQ
ncbi:MAG: hypothetical protein DRP01_09330 [Archaeoglobales archaeon]|nr:MAG: hypothetical protein DRP01_09330 [Archaeoglobales archaeon]